MGPNPRMALGSIISPLSYAARRDSSLPSSTSFEEEEEGRE
jgi:hypothetical protein